MIFTQPAINSRPTLPLLSHLAKPSIWVKSICGFLSLVLSSKTKRLIFIATLFAGIKNITELDKRSLQKFNELLKLSEIDEAIGLPMMFGNSLWRRKLPEGIFVVYQKRAVLQLSEVDNNNLSQAQLRIVANTIINQTPGWLMYGSRRTMRVDLMQLFDILPKMICGSTKAL